MDVCPSQKAYLSVILVDGLFVILIDKGNHIRALK